MTSALTLLRALVHRIGITVVILIVALCATAAATIGPTYYAAAQHSILQDTLADATVVGRGFQTVEQGPVTGSLPAFSGTVDGELNRIVGGKAAARRLFLPPVESLETLRFFPPRAENIPLVWRTDVCAHLRFRSGVCSRGTDEVVISTSLARINHWKVGQQIRPAVPPALTITGVYAIPDITRDYWFERGTRYLATEIPTPQAPPYDALFTSRSTIESLRGDPQGSDVITRVLAAPRVQPGDVDTLQRLGDRLTNSPVLASNQVSVTTGIAQTMGTVHASWSALAVPVIVVTAELLVLTWLLLYLIVTDAVEARGTEIALAKLRGYGAGRALVFGLGEPVVLLAVALPIGALIGWAITGGLSSVLLRSHTPVGLPPLGWLAALVASLGGIAAIIVAARRTLTRPVVEQWRRTGRKATDRGWVFDAVVLTAAVAGLVQLAVTGRLGSGGQSALALLVPGLLGLAIAVVASRALPMICRSMFGRTRRSGGLGPFLAVRHIARRPGGTRTTMILATAVALATFSIAAWSVGASNRTRVAHATVGAPTVLSVVPPPGTDLGAVVDRIDPGGRSAAAVERFDSDPTELFAVQPQRFAKVANWSSTFVDDPESLVSALHPPAPAPIVLNGQQVRLGLDVTRLSPVPDDVTLDVVASGATAPTPVALATIRHVPDRTRLVGSLPGCPCVVRDLQISPAAGQAAQVTGALSLTSLEVHDGHGWQPVPLTTGGGQWSDAQDQQVQVDATGGTVTWSFVAVPRVPATLTVHDRPDPLPGIVAARLAGRDATVQATGLDAGPLQVAVTSHPDDTPGGSGGGVIVDLTYAMRAAAGNIAAATPEVWVRGPVDPIRRGLAAAGVPTLAMRSSAGLDDELSRQGPGLASVLFLADAVAAALLAALAAILSLSAAARRRRYEYAVLGATGASSRSLYGALATEQLVVVGFGIVTGVTAGLLAIALAGRSVPEFVTLPAATLLRYRPSVLVLVVAIGGGALLLIGAAALAAAALLRSVNPEQLREAPS